MGKDQESEETKKAASDTEKELQVFVPVPEYIETLTGEQIEVPKTSWKAEIQIGRLIGTAVNAVPQLSNVDFKSLKITDLVALLPAVMKSAPDAITGIVVLLIKKDKEWVEDNLNSESIMGLLGPFFATFLKRLLKNVNLEQLEALKIPLPRQ